MLCSTPPHCKLYILKGPLFTTSHLQLVIKYFLFAKVQYVKTNGFGGTFVWALDLDDFKGEFCSQGNYSLISYLRSMMDSGNTLRKVIMYLVSK